MTKTYGDFIKANPTDKGAQRLDAAIKADARKRAESERLHPLKNYPYKPMCYPINPTA